MSKLRPVCLALAATALLLVVGGCAQSSLHPRFGKAFDAMWTAQAAKGRVAPQSLLTGEEVEIIMTNHRRSHTLSEVGAQKTGGGIGVLPLQR